MEQIISQITASQGLSAVATMTLVNLLLIALLFVSTIANLQRYNVLNNHLIDYMNANTERFDLLSASHKEINNKYSDAIARGHKTRQEINERFEDNEQRFHEFAKAVNDLCMTIKIQETKPTTPTSVPTSNKQPKFKLGDKAKTNTGNFVGKIVDRVKDNGKFIYVVENKKGAKYYSESTLRHA